MPKPKLQARFQFDFLTRFLECLVATLLLILIYGLMSAAFISNLHFVTAVIFIAIVAISVCLIIFIDRNLRKNPSSVVPRQEWQEQAFFPPLDLKTRPLHLNQLIDQIYEESIWGSTSFESYLRTKFGLAHDEDFELINHLNFHWVTRLNGVEVDNPGGGDCFFYAFSLGLAAVITENTANDAILLTWCRFGSASMQAWVDPEAGQFNADLETQQSITKFRENLCTLATADQKDNIFWAECQQSLRVALANLLKHDFNVQKPSRLPHNFITDDYLYFLRDPDCKPGNFFKDIKYKINKSERSCRRGYLFAFIPMQVEPTIDKVRKILKKLSTNFTPFYTLILYNDKVYTFDQHHISELKLNPTQQMNLVHLLSGYSIPNHAYNVDHLKQQITELTGITCPGSRENIENVFMERFYPTQDTSLNLTPSLPT